MELEVRDGEAGREWIPSPFATPSRPWVGSLAKFSEKTPDHSLDAVRGSIARERVAGEPLTSAWIARWSYDCLWAVRRIKRNEHSLSLTH